MHIIGCALFGPYTNKPQEELHCLLPNKAIPKNMVIPASTTSSFSPTFIFINDFWLLMALRHIMSQPLQKDLVGREEEDLLKKMAYAFPRSNQVPTIFQGIK